MSTATLQSSTARFLAKPILVALALRSVAALTGSGWFALDDYNYVIAPAGRWLLDPDAPFNSPLRSDLFPRVFSALLGIARDFGASSPSSQLQWAYFALGLWSLLAIPPIYLIARKHFDESAARMSAWLVSAFALIPYVSTFALQETVAIPPLLWSLSFAERAQSGSALRRWASGCASGILLGCACLFRFQLGVVYAALIIVLGWPRRSEFFRRTAALAGLILGGAIAATLEGWIDIRMGRWPFETIYNYLEYNITSSANHGTSPWYNYLFFFIGLTLPPATFALLRPLRRAMMQSGVILATLLIYVGTHMLIGHKEDRFMFPMVPLFFAPLGFGLSELRNAGFWRRSAYRYFWVVNTVALLVITPSDPQRYVTAPLIDLRNQHPGSRLATVGIGAVPAYYAGNDLSLTEFSEVDEVLFALETGTGRHPDFILFRTMPLAWEEQALSEAGLSCRYHQTYPGDAVDRALVRLNPRGNRRRAPTFLFQCSQSAP